MDARRLAATSADSIHVADIGLLTATDPVILRAAADQSDRRARGRWIHRQPGREASAAPPPIGVISVALTKRGRG
jgi:hypothetical protein